MKKMKTIWIIMGFMVLGIVSIFAFVGDFNKKQDVNIEPTPIVTTSTATTTSNANYISYGKVNLKVGETAKFKDVDIKLVRVFDESRCPTGVTCIWAGTVKIELSIFDGKSTTTQVLELGKNFKDKNVSVNFLSASPYPKEGVSFSEKDFIYTITLDVSKTI